LAELDNRRPIASRGSGWAKALAALLARAGVSPNAISAMSVAFAILGAACFLRSASTQGWAHAIDLILAALCIQLRLVCNLLDGLVAVEHAKGSTAGPIWNELPDRFADVFFLASAGYAAGLVGMGEIAPLAGWIAAAAAVTTAYVRELGRGLGFAADFSGPFAKPQRMAALTLTAVVAAIEGLWGWEGQSLVIGLGVIALGTLATVARRTLTLARHLKQRAG
jgi:phosphatidylglycerophosphate synthase